MIVTLKYPVRSFAGISKDGTLVYRKCWDECVYIGSVYVRPTITEHNHRQGSKLTRANALYKQINTVFIEDLKIYASEYNRKYGKKKRLPANFYNIFIKALCSGAVQVSDLESLEKFVSVFGGTVEEWISHGLLPKVKAEFLGVGVMVNEEAIIAIAREIDIIRAMFCRDAVYCVRRVMQRYAVQADNSPFLWKGELPVWSVLPPHRLCTIEQPMPPLRA